MAIKSFVKIKPIKDDGPFSGSFNEIRKGINRTGAVTESIANNMVETHKLIRFEKEWLSERSEERVEKVVGEEVKEKKGFKKWLSNWTKMFRRKKRDQAEKLAEKGIEDGHKENEGLKEKAAKKALGFFGRLAKFLGPLFNFFVLYGAFDWLSKNSEKAKKVFQVIFGIGKFAFALAGFGVDALFGGLGNMFGNFKEGPIKRGFRFLFGFLSFVGGFGVLRYLLNPMKIFTDGRKIKKIFGDQTKREVEAKNYEMWRKTGYRDKETGKIYTEKEYKAQKKSVERQQKKLKAQGKHNEARKVGAAHNKRVGATHLQKGKNIGGKLMQPGMQKGIAAVGGITRAMSGIASGEDATQAVGAGLGQAAGGMIGSALLTPFLGPFGPIVGNALGGFLGEWIGKTFLPVIKPIFEPIKETFMMFKDLIGSIFADLGVGDFLGTLFQFIGQLGGLLMKGLKPLMSFVGFILGGAIKIIGGIISFIIGAAKNIFAFLMNPIGFAWDVIWKKDPGRNVKLPDDIDSKAEGGKVSSGTTINIFKSEPPPMFLGGLFGKKRGPWKPPKGWKPKYVVTDEVHVENYIRSIEYKITNVPKHVKGTGERIFSGDTYVGYTAEEILAGKHKVKKETKKEDKEGEKPTPSKPKGRGFKGVLGGIADSLTGGIFDFDKRGNNKLQDLQQLPFKMALQGAKGVGNAVKGIGKGVMGGIGALGKGIKGLFGGNKKDAAEIVSPPEEPAPKPGWSAMSIDQMRDLSDQRTNHLKQFQYKAQRDKDNEKFMPAPRTLIRTIRQPVINNSGNNPVPVYAPTSPMFTC